MKKKSGSKSRKEKETKATILAEKSRSAANALTDAERESLSVDVMRLFYGGAKKAHANRG